MPRYSNNLELAYNILFDARVEILNEMPTPEQITAGLSQADILRRDGWFFMVRVNEILRPYYFDAVLLKVLPFGGAYFGGGGRSSYSQRIGNGTDHEIIVRHGLRDTNITVNVWKPIGDRMEKVDCEVFQLLDSNNHVGLWFADAPNVDEFIVSILGSGDQGLSTGSNSSGIGGFRGSFSQRIGNGVDREIIVNHGLGDTNVTATVWKPIGDRMAQVDCEVFQLLDSNNHIGFWFADIPGVDEFIASVS